MVPVNAMLSFRFGQRWKEETDGEGDPHDAFRFEIDGINLVPGVSDEPLVRTLTALTQLTLGLVRDAEPTGQLSFERSHLEVCFTRRAGLAVQVLVVDLASPSPPPKPVHIDLTDLVGATVAAGRTFLRDGGRLAVAHQQQLVSLEQHIAALDAATITEWDRPTSRGYSLAQTPKEGLGFFFFDDAALTQTWTRRNRAALPVLLCPGALTYRSGRESPGIPFLQLNGLARLAARGGTVAFDGHSLAAAEIFEAGISLALALRARNPALASNPYVEALLVRCTDGLSALRAPRLDTKTREPPRPSAPTNQSAVGRGALRKVHFTQQWERPIAVGEDGGRLVMAKGLIMVATKRAVHALTSKGATVFRRQAERALVALPTADVIVCDEERVIGYANKQPSARWLRNFDLEQLGPFGEVHDGVIITTIDGRGAVGIDVVTGRERWRLAPPRTQRAWFSVIDGRVLMTTDAGVVFGLDTADGQLRFRVKAATPCRGPAVALGHRAVALLNHRERSSLVVFDAFPQADGAPAGSIVWTSEFTLREPCTPVVAKGRVFIAGDRDGAATVIAVGPRGQLLWERRTPCDARGLSLLPYEGGVLVVDARGAAARLLPDGELDWVLGSSKAPLTNPIAPVLRRRLLVVAGPDTRLVEPKTGRVVSSVELGSALTALHVDPKLNLVAYSEPGLLRRFEHRGQLSVVR